MEANAARPEGGKLVGGVWIPATDEHYVDQMKPGTKHHRVVDGKWVYQLHKLEHAMTYIPHARRRLCIDIGAQVGMWSMHLAKLFGQVHAFEPVPLHADLFAANVTMANVTLHRVALGASAGRVSIAVPPAQTGNAHIDGAGDIPLRTLDGFGLDDVDFIKIDVEGYELPVVRGAEETLLRCRPWMVVEQKGNDEKFFGRRRNEATDFLKSLGMVDLKIWSGDHIMGWA